MPPPVPPSISRRCAKMPRRGGRGALPVVLPHATLLFPLSPFCLMFSQAFFPLPSRHLPLTPSMARRASPSPLIFLLCISFPPPSSIRHFLSTRTPSFSALTAPIATSWNFGSGSEYIGSISYVWAAPWPSLRPSRSLASPPRSPFDGEVESSEV